MMTMNDANREKTENLPHASEEVIDPSSNGGVERHHF